jgi:hypothetical protein
MKPTPKNRNASAPRRSYHIRPSDWRRLPPHPPLCDRDTAAPEFDAACWLETAGGAAIAIHTFADHRGDLDE